MDYKRSEKYHSTKFSSESWNQKKLKDLALLITDKINVKQISLEDYVSTENILPNKGGKEKTIKMPSYGNVTRFEKGDILLSNIRPYFKKIWLATNNGGCSNDVLVIRSKNEISNSYLYYCLQQDVFFDYVTLSSKGTKMPRGDKDAILNFEFPIPPLNEQIAIAKILSDHDARIELNQKMNKTLEAIAQAIFKHWFIDFEFPNEEGKPYKSSGGEMVDSELGEIPKGWEVKKLTKIAHVVDCLHSKKPELVKSENYILQLYNFNEIHSIELSDPYTVSDRDFLMWTRNITVKDGDILISNAAKVGAIAQVPRWFVGGIGRNITAIRAEYIGKYYLLYYLTSRLGVSQISVNTDVGTIFNSLNVKGIRLLNVLVPNLDVMKQSDIIFKNLRKKIETNLLENTLLRSTRDLLLPKLMFGKVRVSMEE